MYLRPLYYFIAILNLLTLSACTNITSETRQSQKTLQTGDKYDQLISDIYAENKINIAPEKVVELISTSNSLDNAEKQLLEEFGTNIIELYELGLLTNTDELSLSRAMPALSENTVLLQALLTIFPIDSYSIIRRVRKTNIIDKEQLLSAIVQAGLDPTLAMEITASGLENTITPLIHSASITLYNQVEESTSDIKYRQVGAETWEDGLSFSWDPIYGALSGSIFNLKAATTYEVEIQVNQSDEIKNYSYQFTTNPDSPPIDPTKVYYLSEIYNGGKLDLEALNIFGSPDGYAKIIGDGPIIRPDEGDLAAVNIGRQSYVMLENLTIRGGLRYGIFADRTHHIWIKGCDIAEFGRTAYEYRGGKAYSSGESSSPINYDSGIYLEKSGIAVIEECEIHNPNLGANHWGNGHPNGANAIQMWAYHPDVEKRGQFIIRNNRLYGSDDKRFNDVIEGRKNSWRVGGFVRDSAIYGNYIAYANDDLLEIDGGQSNVLVYDNELTQGYAGISIAPNRLGPSYIFHNLIYNLGDERGREWAAIKAGGLLSQPAGVTRVYENVIFTNRNGIAASSFQGDKTFWIETQNNVIITRNNSNMVGYGIYDEQHFLSSHFFNDVIYNISMDDTKAHVSPETISTYNAAVNTSTAQNFNPALINTLEVDSVNLIPNISIVVSEDDDIDSMQFLSEECLSNCNGKLFIKVGTSD